MKVNFSSIQVPQHFFLTNNPTRDIFTTSLAVVFTWQDCGSYVETEVLRAFYSILSLLSQRADELQFISEVADVELMRTDTDRLDFDLLEASHRLLFVNNDDTPYSHVLLDDVLYNLSLMAYSMGFDFTSLDTP